MADKVPEDFKFLLNIPSAVKIMNESPIIPGEENFRPLIRYKGCTFPYRIIKGFTDLDNFEAREDDVIVAAFPKTGSTWMSEAAYRIVKENFEEKIADTLEKRVPWLEGNLPGMEVSVISETPSPRCVKTHLPYQLLPNTFLDKKCKILYVARNPKDTAVSLEHMYRMVKSQNFNGTFDDLVEKFMKDEVFFGPFPDHVLSYWNRRNDDNVLFLKYEDLKKDLLGEIKKISQFLGKNFSEEQLQLLAKRCHFESMSKNPSNDLPSMRKFGLLEDDKKFYRKGQIGDWHNHFSPDLDRRFSEWIKQRFGDTIQFDYE